MRYLLTALLLLTAPLVNAGAIQTLIDEGMI